MRHETDGRAPILAAAALAAACFAARPATTLPRLEPGFGKPRGEASLPPLPRGEASRGPTAQERFDEILHDAPADVPDAAAPASRAGRRANAARPGAAAGASKTEPARGDAPRAASAGRELSSAEPPRPETPAHARSVSRDGRGGAGQPGEKRRSAAIHPNSPEFRTAGFAPAPSVPRARHSSGRQDPVLRDNGGDREGDADGRATFVRPRAEREESLFGPEKPPARRRGERYRGQARRRAPDVLRERRKGERPRFRPLLLASLLGPRALRPPPAELEPPPAPTRPRPARNPGGKALPAAPAGLAALDSVDPAALGRDRRRGAHWDGDQFHDGDVRGLSRADEWLWLRRDGADWWAFAGGAAQVRRDGVWWTKADGVWFVVHDGAPWAWRSFQDWNAQGLFHPASGTEMVYSRDFARVALVTPGEGAEVFDAETGEKLADIPEARMPPRRRPKMPEGTPPPADVFAQ